MLIIIFLQILIFMWLVRYLLKRDTGAKEPRAAIIAACLFGVLGVVIGMVLELFVIPSSSLPTPDDPNLMVPITKLIAAAALIGLIEEYAKAGPLARWIGSKGYFTEVSDGIIYFGIAGLAFGALENIGYALSFGASVGLIRILTIPFMHAGFSSIIGFAYAHYKVSGGSRGKVFGAYLLAAGLHGLYDFGLLYKHGWSIIVSLVITVVANLIIFRLYKRARREDVTAGRAAVQ